jgi:hypothetical protein
VLNIWAPLDNAISRRVVSFVRAYSVPSSVRVRTRYPCFTSASISAFDPLFCSMKAASGEPGIALVNRMRPRRPGCPFA